MTESKLNPFDAELLVMIGDIAKSQPEVEEKPDRYEITVDTTEIQENAIEALKQAVAGRLGKRLLVTHTLDAAVVFNVEYDPTEYPEQIRTRLVEPDATAGTRYCRTLLEVDAIQVRRDDFHEFRTADYARKHKAICESEKKAKLVNTCKGSPIIYVRPTVQMENQPERKREYKKPEAFDVPKEVEAMAEFFGEMFPGTTVEIHRVEMPRRNPRDKRRGKNKRKGGRHNEK